LKASTVIVMARPGNNTSHHGGTSTALSESASMLPRVGVGSGMPHPEKAERGLNDNRDAEMGRGEDQASRGGI
jgi:hypothetical protein